MVAVGLFPCPLAVPVPVGGVGLVGVVGVLGGIVPPGDVVPGSAGLVGFVIT